MILGDNPVTYRLFPGFSASCDVLLERLLDLDLERDLDTDLLYRLYGEGEGEYLDLLEYDIIAIDKRRRLALFED